MRAEVAGAASLWHGAAVEAADVAAAVAGAEEKEEDDEAVAAADGEAVAVMRRDAGVGGEVMQDVGEAGAGVAAGATTRPRRPKRATW